MYKLASCLLSAAVLGVVCQGYPLSPSSLRRGTSSEAASNIASLQRLAGVSAQRIHDDRPRRDVLPSSYQPTVPPQPIQFTTTTYPTPVYTGEVSKQADEGYYNGVFDFSFETEDGIIVQAKGSPKSLNTGEVVQTMEGQYSYTAPDGTPITTKWFADETGFHAEGAHIPGSKRLRRSPESGELSDNSY